MKYFILIFSIFFLQISTLWAQIDLIGNNSEVNADLPNTAATIVFFRQQTNVLAFELLPVFVNNKNMAQLPSGTYTTVSVPAGQVALGSSAGNQLLLLRLNQGEVYYVECMMVPGFWAAKTAMYLTDSNNARAFVQGGSLVDVKDYKPVEFSPTRFSLLFGGGIGLESEPFFVLEDGSESTLSGGGGVYFGLEMGRLIGKNFDISGRFTYQYSSLSQPIKNGDASFGRFGLGITPALSFATNSNKSKRILLGAGPTYYFGRKMKLEASNAGGGDGELAYNPGFGFQISGKYMAHISKKSSFTFEIQYVSVKATPENFVNDPFFDNLDGASIDFIFAWNFAM